MSAASRAPVDLGEAIGAMVRLDRVAVPPYPAVALQVQRAVAEGQGLRRIAAIVGADAALAAMVLGQANSARHGSTMRVETLEAAAQRLGGDELVRLAVAATVGVAARRPGPLWPLRRECWSTSLCTAILCQALAPRRALRPDQAFTAGLLHGFGAVVVLASLEQVIAEHDVAAMPASTWRELVQDFASDFGIIVAARWRLPDAVAEVMANHQYPEAALRIYRPLVQLVVTVREIVRTLVAAPEQGIAALTGLPGLQDDDRDLVERQLPRVAEVIAGFERALDADGAAVAPSKIVAEPSAMPGAWPTEVAVAVHGHPAPVRALVVAPLALAVESTAPLVPQQLLRVLLADATEAISLTMVVRSCALRLDGTCEVVLQPFGLDGLDMHAWRELVARSRRALGLPPLTERQATP